MRRLAVLGQPVAHSRSPQMHNAAFAALGLADQWHYEAIEVEAADFDALIGELPGRGFAGVNVTVPHKARALARADHASERARAIGAANTLSFRDGEVWAENTDAPGLIGSLPGPVAGQTGLVLGAGGAARAVVWALLDAGAKVTVWNRTATRAKELCDELGGRPWDGAEASADFDLIVNASAAGLGGGDPFAALPLDAQSFRSGQTVVDMVYGEEPSRILARAAAAGAATVDGLEILVGQGACSFEIWTGLEAPRAAMRAAVRGN